LDIIIMLASFDLISSAPKLLINNGQSRFKNAPGGLVTLLYIVSILTIAIFFLTRFLYKNDFSLIYSKEIMKLPSLNFTDVPFMLMLADSVGVPVPNSDKTYFIQEIFLSYQNEVDPKTGKNTIVNRQTNIFYEKCDLNIHFGKYQEYFKDLPDFDKYYCYPLGKFNRTLNGLYGDNINGYSFPNIYAAKCVNNTANKNGCFPMDVIDNSLKKVYFYTAFLDFDTDPYNVDDPVKLTLRTQTLPISSLLSKRHYVYKTLSRYTTDYGIFFEEKKSIEFYTHKDTLYTDVLVGPSSSLIPTSIGHISIFLDNKLDTYVRLYPKIQQLIANIGGVSSAILQLSRIIIYLYSHYSTILFITNEIYFGENKMNKDIIVPNNIKPNYMPVASFNILTKNSPQISSPYFDSMMSRTNEFGKKKVKRVSKLKFSFMELICFFKNNHKTRKFKIYETSILKMLSVEYILSKIKSLNEDRDISNKDSILPSQNNQKLTLLKVEGQKILK
jgi:hypothetical protein